MTFKERSFLGLWGIGFLIILMTVTLVCVELSRAGMRRGNPLDKMAVLYWNAGTPDGAEYEWQGQVKLASGEWTPVAIGSGITIEPGDCLAYMQGIKLAWRSCFVNDEGNVCYTAEGTEACIGHEISEKLVEPCLRIYDISGAEFSSDLVARWNADHVEEP
jgi:hypothetical protein